MEAKVQGAVVRQARVRGPHAGERLRHVSDRVLHCARSHGFRAGCDDARSVTLREEQEEWERVAWHAKQVGADADSSAKAFPDAPGTGSGGVPMRRVVGM